MDHSISVTLAANIANYQKSMAGASQISSDTLAAISRAFSGIQSTAEGALSSVSSSLNKTGDDMDATSDKSDNLASKVATGLVAAFVAATAAIGALTAKGLIAQEALAQLAISTDTSASKIGKFEEVAAQSNMTLGQFSSNLTALQKAMTDAAKSGDNSIFDTLGVKITDSNGALRDTTTVAIEAATAVNGLGSEAAKYDAAAKLGFSGKVQLLEDIANATTLVSGTTDDQAEAVVRLGKIWHDILPGGTSMWSDISKFLSNNLTPAMTQASISILDSKNKIVDAFNQIYGGGSKFQQLGDTIKTWGTDVSTWFAGVVKSATDASLSLAKYIAVQTGLGNPNATASSNATPAIPQQTPLTTGNSTVVETDAAKALRLEYEALMVTIKEKIALQTQETTNNATLTDGQRMLVKVTNDLTASGGAYTDSQKAQLTAQLNTLVADEKINATKATQRAADLKAFNDAQTWYAKTVTASATAKTTLDAENGSGDQINETRKQSITILQQLTTTGAKLTDAQKANIVTQRAALDAESDLIDAQKRDEALRDARLAQMVQEVDASQKQTQELTDQVKYYGLTATAVLQLKAAELERQLQNQTNDAVATRATQEILDQTQQQIDLQTKLTKMKADTQFWDSLESSAKSVFDSITTSGANTWAALRTSAEKLFFDWLYQMTIKQWIINIGTSISGASSVAGLVSSSAGASGSTLSGASSLLQVGKSAYDTYSNALGASLGTAVAGFGNLIGSSAISAFGAGMGLSASQAAAAAEAYTSAGMGTTASALTAGSTAGAAAGVVGGVGVGLLGGKLISGQYGSNATVVAGTAIGAAIGSIVPVLGTAIGAAIGGIIGGIGNRLFGMGDKTVTSQGVEGTLSTAGTTGDAYATWSQSGGLFRSDKSGIDRTALDPATVSTLNSGLGTIETSMVSLAKTLGVGTDSITDFSTKFNLVLTGDTTKDTATLTAFFQGVSDQIATGLVPALATFQASGETLTDTLVRVVGDYSAISLQLQTIGSSVQQAFGATGTAALSMTEQLVAAAGGIDALNTSTTYFATNFLTPAQQVAPIIADVTKQLGALGLAGITTNDQFSAAVLQLTQSGALATASGQAQYVALLALAPEFKQMTDYLTQAATDAAAAAQAASDAAAAAATAAAKQLADNQTALQGGVSDALTAAQNAIDAKKTTVTDAFNALMAGLASSVTTWTAKIADLQSLSDLVDGAKVGATSNSTSLASAQAQLQSVLAIAKASGVLPTADSIKDAVTAVTADTSSQFASLLDYQHSQQVSAQSLAGLSGVTDTQLTTAQKTLLALQNQQSAATAANTAQLAALDALSATETQQAQTALGTYKATLSVSAGIATLAASITALAKGATTDNPTGTGLSVEDLYETVLGRTGDSAGLAFWTKAFGDTIDSTEYAQFIAAAQPELDAKADGTWAQYLAAHGAGGTTSVGSSSDTMQAALDSLNTQMSSMQASMARTATSTQQLAQQFDNVSAGGNSLLTTTA